MLVINDVEAREMLLWYGTAPRHVLIRIKRAPGQEASLKLWNIWRGRVGNADLTQAWLGNAGMRIKQSADGKEILLQCSDGEGPIDFHDLKVRIRLKRHVASHSLSGLVPAAGCVGLSHSTALL